MSRTSPQLAYDWETFHSADDTSEVGSAGTYGNELSAIVALTVAMAQPGASWGRVVRRDVQLDQAEDAWRSTVIRFAELDDAGVIQWTPPLDR
ncbi:hypothetical protein AB0K16_19385 [Nonomuraea jabiensis]|uniref:hypothetical protein n=1 Tax=Nonomuraea jabiensis TaxID=882448 RepID=UPI00343BB734